MTFDSVGGGYGAATNYRHQANIGGGGDLFGGPFSIPTPSGNDKSRKFPYLKSRTINLLSLSTQISLCRHYSLNTNSSSCSTSASSTEFITSTAIPV